MIFVQMTSGSLNPKYNTWKSCQADYRGKQVIQRSRIRAERLTCTQHILKSIDYLVVLFITLLQAKSIW